MARRGRAAPPARLRPRRRHPVAEPDRRRGDRPARPAARRARPAAPATELLERFELDPTQEGPRLLQGQPAEGRPGRRAGLRRRAADPGRAHLGPGPADGGGVPRVSSTRSAASGRTVLLSSHILAEVEALCDRVSIIRDGRTVETGTLAELRHLTRTSIEAELAGPPTGLDGAARRARPASSTGTGSASTSTPRTWTTRCGSSPRLGVRSLTSQPPTLEELFLRHYGDDAAGRAVRGGRHERLAGTGTLVRLALRRDRVLLPGLAGVPGDRRRPGRAGGDGRALPRPRRRGSKAAEAVNATPALGRAVRPVYDPTSLGAHRDAQARPRSAPCWSRPDERARSSSGTPGPRRRPAGSS